MISGGLTLVNYGETGPVWHSRPLLAHAGDDDWAILTPEHDVYIETMSLANPDFSDFHYCGVNGAVLGRIDPASVYVFRPLRPTELGAFRVPGPGAPVAPGGGTGGVCGQRCG